MNTQKRHTRGAYWGFLVAGPLLLPAALSLAPVLLIPLGLWFFLRVQHSQEQRRLALQKRNAQRGFIVVNTQRRSIQEALLMRSDHALGLLRRPHVLHLQGEIVLLVFPNNTTRQAKEYILSTLVDSSDHTNKPEMIVLTQQ